MLRPLVPLFVVATVASAGCRASTGIPAPDAISDANIVAIVVTANTADILYAELALAKSQDSDIHDFATMVKKDHESVTEVASLLVQRLGVTPEMNSLAFDLRDDAETKRLTLRDFEDFAFDSAYSVNEVSYHETLLHAIDDALIPSAQNAELKALLVQVRPAIGAHLEHARRLVTAKARR